MKAKRNSTSIVISGIYNESMLEDVTIMADKSGCKYTTSKNSTVVTITGTAKQLDKFAENWNNQ